MLTDSYDVGPDAHCDALRHGASAATATVNPAAPTAGALGSRIPHGSIRGFGPQFRQAPLTCLYRMNIATTAKPVIPAARLTGPVAA